MCESTAPAYCLAGATATGKSAVVQRLAERHRATILSADAMLVYQGMDIGTAKPTQAERTRVTYYGLDCVTPAEDFSTAAWLAHGQAAFTATVPCFVTGGTGLYFSALLRGLEPTPPGDPDLRARLERCSSETLRQALKQRGAELSEADWANPRRLVRALEILELGGALPKGWGARPKPPLLALTWERAALHRRIAERVEAMYREGLLEETAALRAHFPQWSRTATQAIGYAEAAAVLEGTLSLDAAKERTIIRTRQLARRQETYLRHQFEITWLPVREADTVETVATRVEAQWGLR